MAKKFNIENPAELFITKPAETTTAPATVTETAQEAVKGKAPEGYKLNPMYVETRSKRLQLLVQPSVVEKLKAKAQREGRSLNDIIHSILEEAVREE